MPWISNSRNVLLWQVENSKSLAIIKALVEQYHFDVNQPDDAGASPLMLAAKRKESVRCRNKDTECSKISCRQAAKSMLLITKDAMSCSTVQRHSTGQTTASILDHTRNQCQSS